MPRYVAFLRGVSPLNVTMAELRRCFAEAGFADVKTLLSSGNVAFTPKSGTEASLERFRTPPADDLTLPAELDGVKIHRVVGREAFTTYLPSLKGPVFMALLERTFGKTITTRTYETVRKCAEA